MTRRISIAMATYNGAAFLRAQLDSLVGQTLPPAEIVICDDDSTDDTRALVADYATASPVPIRLVHNRPRLGWRGNFIKAAGLCSGELIGFCDQDDVWYPAKLAEIAARFDRPGVLMAYHDFRLVDRDLQPLGASPHPRVAALSPPLGVDAWLGVLGFTIMFDARLLRFWPLWPSSIDKHQPGLPAAHDQWLVFLASTLGETAYVDAPLADYRQHGANAVGMAPAGASGRSRPADAARHLVYLDNRIGVIDNRLSLIEGMRALDAEAAGRLDAAAAAYARYRAILAAQRELYRSTGIARRLATLAGAMAGGAYLGGPWRLAPRAALRDAMTALRGAPGLDREPHG